MKQLTPYWQMLEAVMTDDVIFKYIYMLGLVQFKKNKLQNKNLKKVYITEFITSQDRETHNQEK